MQDTNANHFDLETLRSNLEYDDSFVSEFLTLLKNEFEVCLVILREELQKENIKKINATAHRIKGTALNGCCKELVVLAATLENTLVFDKAIISDLVEQITSEMAFIKTLIP